MKRVRFYVIADDPRPINFPPPGPYWISGQTMREDEYILVAFVNNEKEIYKFWPEAEKIDIMQEDVEVTFSDRFSEPEWWKALNT